MVTPAPLVARGILRLFADAALAGQKKAFGHDGSLLGSRGAAPNRLGAQMLATLGATTAQDGAAAGGGHAGAETVGAGSSDFTGLVCSLHCHSYIVFIVSDIFTDCKSTTKKLSAKVFRENIFQNPEKSPESHYLWRR